MVQDPRSWPWFVRASLLLTRTLVVIAVLNGILGVVWMWRDSRPRSQLLDQYGIDRLLTSYPGWTATDLEALLFEDGTVSEYEPLTEFRPKQRHGRFVSVDPRGFRVIENQRPWPPDQRTPAVFVFGGSTAFGAGVRDEDTIPSHLQALLMTRGCSPDLAIYNFGRPNYFSSQERVLFENLLAEGHVPAIAIFVDGVNEFYHWRGVPGWSDEIHALVEHARARGGILRATADLARRTPFGRTAEAISRRIGIDAGADAGGGDAPNEVNDPVKLRGAIDRWLANKRLIEATAREFRVRAVFVWQPAPTHDYDLTAHNLARGNLAYFRAHQRSHYGYALMETIRPTFGLGKEVLWLDDIQRNRTENLYVDGMHYTPAFSAEIAERIASHLTANSLDACRTGTR